MSRITFKLYATVLFALVFSTACLGQVSSELRIDPLLLVSLKECRNIRQSLGDGLFTGWDFLKTPVLFYRPNVQEVLLNFPHKPKGFSEYTGFNPLGNETIYYRNDTTFFNIDDQNTSFEIDGITVLVVADPFSSMRNQLRDIYGRPGDFVSNWLNNWNFIPSPYSQLQVILHEAFHVYQNKMAPDKGANEMIVSQYPLLDPTNNALYVLEGNILKDALFTQDPTARREKVKEFAAVRSFRQSRLDSSWFEYENLNEFSEGLAKYVEYKFLRLGENIQPIKEMYYHYGFRGYGGVLSKEFQNAMNNMVNIVAVNDDRFGNKFGSGPFRFKLYELGACQALLLDEVMPSWKEKIFGEKIYLSDLLKQALAMSAGELERYLTQAKNEYRYDEAYQSKLQFEREGKKKIEEKLSSILDTKQTLVKISYGGFVDKIGLGGFTPFGVTQVTQKSAIYEMVPITVLFKKDVTLRMKQVIPVLIDRDKKMVAFAIPTSASKLQVGADNKLETDEFILSGNKVEIKRQSNTVEIQLR